MRNPILHIKLSDLEKVLRQLDMKPELGMKILEIATKSKFQLRDRYMVVAKTAKGKKKVEKTINAESDIVERFNRMLTSLIQIGRSKNVPAIHKDSKNYTLLKEIALLAHTYTEDFKVMPQEEGYKQFVQLAMQIMGKKYKLEKIKYYLPKIYEITDCLMLIEADDNKEGSKEFYRLWKTIGLRYSTGVIDLVKSEDFVHIIYGRMEADESKAKYENWITAQFDQLTFLNSIPEMSQLYGLNAKKRYQTYMAKKGIKQESQNSFLAPDKEYKTEEERAYWEMIKQKRDKLGS